ncbi:hypothetical protein AeRB84_017121 [Aphanomyces euteiches]|nr:hypothetical protein AeRB84_017121 [Aphanomyces euteiches]
MKSTKAPLLPVDLVVTIAFFIPEFETFTLYLKALRAVNALGPLEHLWKLHRHHKNGWPEQSFWRQLNLSAIGDECRGHVEHIAKYFSKIIVNSGEDPAWLYRYIPPTASIYWTEVESERPSDVLWERHFRIVSLNVNSTFSPDSILPFVIEILPQYQHLTELYWQDCDSEVTPAIFKVAASSLSLRKLSLWTSERGIPRHSTITTSMAKDLLTWITLQPIELLRLMRFNWEFPTLRNEIVSVLAKKEFIVEFGFYNNNNADEMQLDFAEPKRHGNQAIHVEHVNELPLDDIATYLSGFFQPFFQLLGEDKVKKLKMCGRGIFKNNVIWDMLVPYMKKSHLAELDLQYNYMTDSEAILLSQGICSVHMLRKINLMANCMRFPGLNAFLTAAPPSVRNIYFCYHKSDIYRFCLSHECQADQKLINLFG